MKRLLLTCAALIMFTATAFAYKVGDIIEIGGDKCVVFDVTTDGQHGKAMSVSQMIYGWEQAKELSALFVQHGMSWRLPKIDELKIIYNKKAILNSVLTAKGYEELNDFYWSSEERNSDFSWGILMNDGGIYDGLKSNRNYVRFVSAF